MSEHEVVLVGYVRTAFGDADSRRGAFRGTSPDELAERARLELSARTGIPLDRLGSSLPGIGAACSRIARGEDSLLLVGGHTGSKSRSVGPRAAPDARGADAWASRGRERAARAQRDGVFFDEIVPIEGLDPDGQPAIVARDAIDADRTVGAAVCLLLSAARARDEDVDPIARLVTTSAPSAIAATERLLEHCGRRPAGFDLLELDDAIAPLALLQRLNGELADLDERLNVNGGFGASGNASGGASAGALLVGSTAFELRRRGGGVALAVIASDAGRSTAAMIEVDV